jgi:hypothetical protein
MVNNAVEKPAHGWSVAQIDDGGVDAHLRVASRKLNPRTLDTVGLLAKEGDPPARIEKRLDSRKPDAGGAAGNDRHRTFRRILPENAHVAAVS